jgi:tRNA (guanine37-N1)-methyltransferase
MLLKPEPVFKAIRSIKSEESLVILTTPQGAVFNQATAQEFSNKSHLIFVCGHYEGVDERIRTMIDVEMSIGDYVLTSGNLAAMVMVDSIVRLLPGVLGSPDSEIEESFSDGLLEYPQYTRPEIFEGMTVPKVLLSGHHKNIEKWRQAQAVLRTEERRPDLLKIKK